MRRLKKQKKYENVHSRNALLDASSRLGHPEPLIEIRSMLARAVASAVHFLAFLSEGNGDERAVRDPRLPQRLILRKRVAIDHLRVMKYEK